ncbi:hypothetical protein [Streptacidiphilus melanogenes]|uniref:hypothetical protein n=1 Tax=Streptacidiphilus melanogenes TaxID=411235 RepID=UPI0005A766A7|nr:hypothetical protein [Streptacidiphilus melanogenes]
MHFTLSGSRPSTLLLASLLLALFTTTPVPLALVVAVVVWLLHTPAALAAGVALTLGWRILHPKAAR